MMQLIACLWTYIRLLRVYVPAWSLDEQLASATPAKYDESTTKSMTTHLFRFQRVAPTAPCPTLTVNSLATLD
ncbi:Uncharacterized protein HZ326_3256 [Fusarium oxysporum f. sp. albedinis]|nr:Uncharacterized protein HZ326_3256 [Fusarium oxysporum f. sp. albedinis]